MDAQDKYLNLISSVCKHPLIESGEVVLYHGFVTDKFSYPVFDNSHTILLYRIDGTDSQICLDDMLYLFQEVKTYNIKCLIIHGYDFVRECTIDAPKCLREVVFSKCEGVTQVFYPFFDHDSNITSVTFLNINRQLQGLYCLARCYLENNNYKMRYMSHVTPRDLEKHKEDRDACLVIVERNKNGYE